MYQNTPNPFNPVTSIAYDVPAGVDEVTIRVFDVNGRRVTTLVEGLVPPGRHVAVWDGTNQSGQSVASGVYYYTLEAAGQTTSRKMLLMK